MKTFTYKTVGDLEIKLDLHRPDDDAVLPAVVWIHGGALIMGHRGGIDHATKKALQGAGCAVLSIDYRLAPETKLPAILDDVADAIAWVREHGRDRLGVDPRRIAVAGGSAGGYLTLTTGYRVKPPPAALVAFWGYGDLIRDWYSRPSPHPRHHQVHLTPEEARRQVAGPPIADARDRNGDGSAFYQHCRQHGSWPREVSGWDPHAEAAKFAPYMPVENVTPAYPPTLLIHGTDDTDVPYEQSTLMAAALERAGVEHQLITIPNAEHGLDGGDPALVKEAYRAAVAFIVRHVRG